MSEAKKCGAKKGSTPWNKGTGKGWTDSRGYRWRYVEVNGKPRQMREHRYVMEQHLGRKLEPWELVHHKDGDTLNNDITNLEVMKFGAHAQEHSIGSRKSYESKKTIEAFALMRGELTRAREINADLYAACEQLLMDEDSISERTDLVSTCESLEKIKAALAKARGEL
jgi:hypothetical protein